MPLEPSRQPWHLHINFPSFCQFWLWLRHIETLIDIIFTARPPILLLDKLPDSSRVFSTNLWPMALLCSILWVSTSISWLQVTGEPNRTCWTTPAYNFPHMSVIVRTYKWLIDLGDDWTDANDCKAWFRGSRINISWKRQCRVRVLYGSWGGCFNCQTWLRWLFSKQHTDSSFLDGM